MEQRKLRMRLLEVILISTVFLKANSSDVREEPGRAEQPSVVPPHPLHPELSHDGYGVDISFPIHHEGLKKGTVHGDRYDKFMKGCFEKYSRSSCLGSEKSRVRLNLKQPPTQQNYTDNGFKHTKAPKEVFDLLKKFFDDHQDKQTIEQWPTGNTYTNHWETPTWFLSLENREFKEGRQVKAKVWDGVRKALEEWTGENLVSTSLYGIRIYKDGAILAPHVDRLPLVTSCIINVAQDLDSPWPVEVYGRDGTATNVTMMPGDMVMYESHTTVHGRPFPLHGRYFANVFVHFEPIDEHGKKKNEGSSESLKYPPPHTDANRKKGLRATLDENHEKYYQHHPHEDSEAVEEAQELSAAFATGSTSLHVAAARGDLDAVKKYISEGEDVLSSDANSWQALHEAARGGHLDVVKELIDAGADLGATTFQGGTALWWARQTLGSKHPVVRYLRGIGAPDLEAVGEL